MHAHMGVCMWHTHAHSTVVDFSLSFFYFPFVIILMNLSCSIFPLWNFDLLLCFALFWFMYTHFAQICSFTCLLNFTMVLLLGWEDIGWKDKCMQGKGFGELLYSFVVLFARVTFSWVCWAVFARVTFSWVCCVCKGHFFLGMLSCVCKGNFFLGMLSCVCKGNFFLGMLSCVCKGHFLWVGWVVRKSCFLASEQILDSSAHDYDNNIFFFKGYFLAIKWLKWDTGHCCIIYLSYNLYPVSCARGYLFQIVLSV